MAYLALLQARGIAHDPGAVAGLYAGLVDTFVLDVADIAFAAQVRASGAQPLTASLLDRTTPGRRVPARQVAGLARS